jgi:hypothetical protein
MDSTMVRTAKIFDCFDENWKFAFLGDTLPPDLYKELADGLETIEWREAATSFYTQREANLATNDYYRTVLSPGRLAGIRSLAEDFFGCTIERKIEVAAHKLVWGDSIGIHTDRNSLGETHRLTIHLNRDWNQEQGGLLMALRERDFTTAIHAWLPLANTGFLFEIGSQSFHAVTSVQSVAPRHSIVFTFREENSGTLATGRNKRWLPFPLVSDLKSAAIECERIGVNINAVTSDFRYATPDEIRDMVVNHSLRAADYPLPPADEPLAPVIAIQKDNGNLLVVEGGRRLLHVTNPRDGVRVVVFRQGK